MLQPRGLPAGTRRGRDGTTETGASQKQSCFNANGGVIERHKCGDARGGAAIGRRGEVVGAGGGRVLVLSLFFPVREVDEGGKGD